MRKFLSFAGKNLSEYGVYISGSGVFNSPVRAYNPLQIPGRNGDILGSEKRMENIEVVYPCFVYANFKQNVADLRAWLLSHEGYQTLSDTYHPDEYRKAYYAGGLEVEPTALLDAGNFELRFMCKPQRYLTSGDSVKTFTNTGTINNPTLFEAKPLIRAYGTGAVNINGVAVTITQADVYTDIDCEIMEAFKGTTNKNQYVRIGANDFPVLVAGSNSVAISGLSRVEITPRWYTV